jgi:hypothetical protein
MALMQMQMLLAQRDREIAQLAQQLADAKQRAERAEEEAKCVAAMFQNTQQQP